MVLDGLNGNLALHRRCHAEGWRAHRLGGDLYLFEASSDTLVRVDERLVGPLLTTKRGSPLRVALRDAAEAAQLGASASAPDPAGDSAIVVPLVLLGVRVDVECRHERCAASVREYYSALHCQRPQASADVVVRCDWSEAGRHLFRAREDGAEGTPLEGVEVRTLGGAFQPWRSIYQPLPPLVAPPFRDRFVALHAAVVRTAAGGGVVLAGERHAGKTVAALALANEYGAELLADKTTFLHCRTTVAEAFPHSVGVWRDDCKIRVPVTEVCQSVGLGSVGVSRLVFLARRPGPVEVHRIAPSDVLRHLLPHHRHGGAPAGDSIATLLQLAAVTPAWSIAYEDHASVGSVVASVCEEIP